MVHKVFRDILEAFKQAALTPPKDIDKDFSVLGIEPTTDVEKIHQAYLKNINNPVSSTAYFRCIRWAQIKQIEEEQQ